MKFFFICIFDLLVNIFTRPANILARVADSFTHLANIFTRSPSFEHKKVYLKFFLTIGVSKNVGYASKNNVDIFFSIVFLHCNI